MPYLQLKARENSMSEQKPLSVVDFGIISALGALLVYLFYPTLREIAIICWNDDDYSHGILLPFVAGYMMWDSREMLRKRFAESRQRIATTGSDGGKIIATLTLIAGLLLFFIGDTSGISFATWASFFPVVLAVIYLTFGRTVAFSVAPAILILFLAKPLPDSLVVRLFWPLQVFAAKFSTWTLELLGVPVFLSGNIIEIPTMKLLVEEACSGMRSVIALFTLCCIIIYFIELRWFSKLALVITSVVIAICMNVFRVALTGVLAHFYDPDSASGFFHTFEGLIVFIVALPLLWGMGKLLFKLEAALKKRKGINA